MLETLINLKNNKVKQPATQAQGVDSVTRLRKFLNGLSKKHHGMHTFCSRSTNYNVIIHSRIPFSVYS